MRRRRCTAGPRRDARSWWRTASRRRAAGLAAALCLLAAWASPAPAADGRLLVSVAVSLKPALEEIVEAWSVDRPRTAVAINAGGSSLLMQQIRRGAPVDLFISASPREVDRLEADDRIVPASRRTVAENTLIVVVPAGHTPPARPSELTGSRFNRVAVGNPKTAPVGRYAEQALLALGVWSELKPRLVLGENARQVLDYVVRAEVAAGVVYRTDARLFPGRLTEGPAIAPGDGGPPVYEAAVLRDSGNADLAAELLEWIGSAAGREILRRFGFGTPGAIEGRDGRW